MRNRQAAARLVCHSGQLFVVEADIGLHVWDLALIGQRLREMGLDWE